VNSEEVMKGDSRV